MSVQKSSPAAEPAGTPVRRAQRLHLSEDWLATVVGLVLLVLVLTGVITGPVVP
ncbi:hypothetical protein Cch01nite_03820 [Cellulomonas chitinilytica]|uniref:Uncharacterized protein n=1 Tax=Cellulomonas chitinilytica TaxID=398759 RepID=A0A919TYF7_9CELL|nr:hypothetical protein [Cellulomonas chitinilytica]GIG19658.1 hypothetical protein Cch01nite_03820 [Cellulomonas chitinilytica]